MALTCDHLTLRPFYEVSPVKIQSTAIKALFSKFCLVLFIASGTWVLSACDNQRIAELEEGVATEADVRIKFGEPEKIWDGADGARIFEYNRQPAGAKNYMITIGTDGKMSSLKQVLTSANFAKIEIGMPMETVRKMLGKPMKITPYELKKTWHYDWRYLEGVSPSEAQIFTVVFDSNMYVISKGSSPDPAQNPH
ncbi:MAG: outer membrane protein assembly factor BamE [Polaromonas sp.]|nr:outer membrane protein assembly factor BamE [Polaromonas sp.]